MGLTQFMSDCGSKKAKALNPTCQGFLILQEISLLYHCMCDLLWLFCIISTVNLTYDPLLAEVF